MNIELGAGCGNFGKKFYPECCLTDKDSRLRACWIDCFCDASDLPFSDNSFDKAIMCNPYNYGFKEPDEAEQLVRELVRVLKHDSLIIIIGSKKNKFCTPKRVEKSIGKMSLPSNITIGFSEQSIDAKMLYPGYTFLTVGGKRPAFPNRRVILNVFK